MSFSTERILRQYRMPCHGCEPPKRHVGCHCDCPEYADAVAEKDKIRAETIKNRMSEDLNYRYFAESMIKLKRRKNL